MRKLISGARQLPRCHISIRVPWHDTGWNGSVCKAPQENLSCLVLRNIGERRDEAAESRIAGRKFADVHAEQLPPCCGEHGAFMSDRSYCRWVDHPYKDGNPELYGHFKKTRLDYPAWSAAAVPFWWMLKGNIQGTEDVLGMADLLKLGHVAEREPELPFQTAWIQEKQNQLVSLDTFFSAIEPEESLCFFYAKRTPLAEDSRRVIVGVGRVTSVSEPVEYEYERNGDIRCVLWERNIGHSIRPSGSDGFLFPLQELNSLAQKDPTLDVASMLAFAPDQHFFDYSYGSNHVSHDAAISSLIACSRALERIAKHIEGPWIAAQKWIDAQLNRIWRMRGPFPGIGSALTAFGLQHGTLLAYEIANAMPQFEKEVGGDAWELLDKVIETPKLLRTEFPEDLGSSFRRTWKALPMKRRRLLELLSRFALNEEQATRWFQTTEREDAGIAATDEEILANPYLLFERDRYQSDPISLGAIDRGLFPDEAIAVAFPVPEPSAAEDAIDPRRLRAFVVDALEKASLDGHTLQPRDWIIRNVRDNDIRPACPLSADVLNSEVEAGFANEVIVTALADGTPAYQLARLADTGKVIAGEIRKRRAGKRHEGIHRWRDLVDAQLQGAALPRSEEERARQEKAAALQELYSSRVSVLIGPAGTGKTTLLKALCAIPEVERGGVLLLAPTGKARVRMQQQTGEAGAKTIAQFLLRLGRYDVNTGRYRTSEQPRSHAHKTVIIDECSMLTEEQLGAVLDGLSGVERLVLVGDPRQLPPIGSGRAFVDIVRHLAPKDVESQFPRVGPGYGELTISRRQKRDADDDAIGRDREDILLARCFAGGAADPGADEIWDRITKEDSPTLRLVRWESPEQLQELIMKVLAEELNLPAGAEENKFEMSLGGHYFDKTNCVYFNSSYENRKGAASQAEAWQILSPVRAGLHGVDALNRAIQQRFRSRVMEWTTVEPHYRRKVPRPLGPQRILYGDKVINIRNQMRKKVWPKAEDGGIPLANGDIGMVVGEYRGQSWKLKRPPTHLEVEFFAWQGRKVTFWDNEFGDEGDPALELAYALTVHKTQGSEFGLTFVVLPNPCRLLSRELLYTALTRQQNRVVVFHQGELRELRNYAVDKQSEVARRLTNLFGKSNPVKVEDRFLEEGLIHRTLRGELVRSKSEVIIANEFDRLGIGYLYEHEFVGSDDSRRYPDFTVEDAASGLTVIWEHLGMLHDDTYRRRWQAKLAWYRRNGVFPEADGGGPRGTLVTSEDSSNGGIDAQALERTMKRVFKL